MQKTKSREMWKESLTTLGLSLMLSLGIHTFVAEARYIPSGSMKPTLQINDRLIIDKLTYDFSSPKRGDIVVFNPTRTLRQENFRDAFIKRIIGLPGETVTIHNGTVYINGSPLKEAYIAAKPDYQFGPVVVPVNSYFVLGDNRNNSYDSHYWGFVPQHDIIGRAIFRVYPFNRIGEFDRPVYVTSTTTRSTGMKALSQPQSQFADIFHPVSWQAVAQVNPLQPLQLIVINESDLPIDYSLSTHTFYSVPPHRESLLNYISTPTHVVIHSSITNSNLKYNVSSIDNIVFVRVRQRSVGNSGNHSIAINQLGVVYTD